MKMLNRQEVNEAGCEYICCMQHNERSLIRNIALG